jgi:hypothetical protein
MPEYSTKCRKISKLEEIKKKGFFIYSKEVIYKYNAICHDTIQLYIEKTLGSDL